MHYDLALRVWRIACLNRPAVKVHFCSEAKSHTGLRTLRAFFQTTLARFHRKCRGVIATPLDVGESFQIRALKSLISRSLVLHERFAEPVYLLIIVHDLGPEEWTSVGLASHLASLLVELVPQHRLLQPARRTKKLLPVGLTKVLLIKAKRYHTFR